jgi:hypothetical protein
MDLDPGGENVSFLVQVVPHPRVRYFLMLLLLIFVP